MNKLAVFFLASIKSFRFFQHRHFRRHPFPCGANNLAVFSLASTESFDFFDAAVSAACRPPLRAVHLSASFRFVNRFSKIFLRPSIDWLARQSLPLRGRAKVSKKSLGSTVFWKFAVFSL